MIAKNKFDKKVLEDGWLADNEITQQYYEQNNERLQQSASLIKDFSDQEFLKEGTMKQLLHDFGTRYKRGDVESVDKYFNMLEDNGADRLFLDAIVKRNEFDQMAEALDDYL